MIREMESPIAVDRHTSIEKRNVFVGEAFGPPNVRVVFAGAAEDSEEREDRVFLLLGPSCAREEKATCIDAFCNFFYDVQKDDNYRLHIANEKFDKSTPNKAIVTYVFNGSKMPFRPIVVDVKDDDASLLHKWLSENARLRIDVVCLVFNLIGRIETKDEVAIKEMISILPKRIRSSASILLTNSDGHPPPVALLRRFDMLEAPVYKLNWTTLFTGRPDDSLKEHLRSNYWKMSEGSLREMVAHLHTLHPQTFNGLPHERPMFALHLKPDNASSSASSTSSSSTTTFVERRTDHTTTHHTTHHHHHYDLPPAMEPVAGLPPPSPPLVKTTIFQTSTKHVEDKIVEGPPLGIPKELLAQIEQRAASAVDHSQSGGKLVVQKTITVKMVKKDEEEDDTVIERARAKSQERLAIEERRLREEEERRERERREEEEKRRREQVEITLRLRQEEEKRERERREEEEERRRREQVEITIRLKQEEERLLLVRAEEERRERQRAEQLAKEEQARAEESERRARALSADRRAVEEERRRLEAEKHLLVAREAEERRKLSEERESVEEQRRLLSLEKSESEKRRAEEEAKRAAEEKRKREEEERRRREVEQKARAEDEKRRAEEEARRAKERLEREERERTRKSVEEKNYTITYERTVERSRTEEVDERVIDHHLHRPVSPTAYMTRTYLNGDSPRGLTVVEEGEQRGTVRFVFDESTHSYIQHLVEPHPQSPTRRDPSPQGGVRILSRTETLIDDPYVEEERFKRNSPERLGHHRLSSPTRAEEKYQHVRGPSDLRSPGAAATPAAGLSSPEMVRREQSLRRTNQDVLRDSYPSGRESRKRDRGQYENLPLNHDDAGNAYIIPDRMRHSKSPIVMRVRMSPKEGQQQHVQPVQQQQELQQAAAAAAAEYSPPPLYQRTPPAHASLPPQGTTPAAVHFTTAIGGGVKPVAAGAAAPVDQYTSLQRPDKALPQPPVLTPPPPAHSPSHVPPPYIRPPRMLGDEEAAAAALSPAGKAPVYGIDRPGQLLPVPVHKSAMRAAPLARPEDASGAGRKPNGRSAEEEREFLLRLRPLDEFVPVPPGGGDVERGYRNGDGTWSSNPPRPLQTSTPEERGGGGKVKKRKEPLFVLFDKKRTRPLQCWDWVLPICCFCIAPIILMLIIIGVILTYALN